MNNILPDTPSSPPITCQPWCEYGDGHPGEYGLDDQRCYGIEHRVTLHLTEKTNDVREGEEPNWQHDYLTVYPQKTFAAEPTVFLGRGELFDGATTMTPDEARHLATELLFAVTQIEEKL